ncbi:DENN domain-containing protein 4B [Blomia tropicalis]|nr:DENN domain-containing protein 4B [Blomia tropicalis]
MDEKRIADYFVIAGVPNQPRKFDQSLPQVQDPITDIAVIIRSNNEPIPSGFVCIEETPSGHKADLNHGSIRSPNVFLCIKRGRDKPPLIDVGILYDEGKERLFNNCQVIKKTPSGFSANVNNSGTQTYITYRRSLENAAPNQLVVTDICIILTNKNETPPHAYMLIEKNLNKGIIGSDVYLCYKKSMDRPPFLSFNPTIIDRFPLEDYPDFSLSEHLPNFCLPMGASIECWPKKSKRPFPFFSTFILTLNSGAKVYASLLNFYEMIMPDELSLEELKYLSYVNEDVDESSPIMESESKSLQRIKSICILSHWPFFDQFKRFLTFLCKTFYGTTIPPLSSLESYIFYFMRDIPFPSPERPNIMVNLAHTTDETLLFTQTFDDLPLPLNGASFKRLLFNLGPENCLHVLLFALTEQKILLHSLRTSILTEVAESIITMIFPFNWHCPYIPMCPMNMSAVLHAPLPFIVGIDSRYFDYFVPPHDVASIDIDTKAIYLSDNKRFLNLKMLPKKETKTLRTTLDSIYERFRNTQDTLKVVDANVRRKMEKKIETEIQEAFLYFMASILKDFRHYLKPITAAPKVGATDPSSLFDMQGFVRSRDPAYQQFYSYLVHSQMFTKFIEERSLVSDKNIGLAFFDECIEKVEKHEKMIQSKSTSSSTASLTCSLIDFDNQSEVNKTVYITIPDTSLPGTPLLDKDKQVNMRNVLQYFGPLNHQKFYKLANDSSLSTGNSLSFENQKESTLSLDNVDSTLQDPYSGLQTYMFARRAKHEIRKSQKIAQQASQYPVEWAKNLLVNSYSLWFTHFPSFSHILLNEYDPESKPLSIAYQVLQRMQTMKIATPDEFCYRILMILCGIHSQPALAVKVFMDMKKYQVRLNAITYGYYNKAVLEGNWPSGFCKWAKLRNTWSVVFYLKRKHIKKTLSVIDTTSTTKANSVSKLNELENNIKSEKRVEIETNVALDYHPNVGLLMSTTSSSSSSSSNKPIHPNLVGLRPLNRKRNKSAGSKPSSPTSKMIESTKVDDNESFGGVHSIDQQSETKITSDQLSFKDGSDENLNDTFSSRFATPIKEAFTTSMDFFSPKSRVGSTLRTSFRMAKSLTKSKYGFSRSPAFHNSEKTLNLSSSLKHETYGASKENQGDLPRSSTMPPQLYQVSIDPSSCTDRLNSSNPTINSPWSNKLSTGKHSDYVYSTFKSAANRINELKSSLTNTTNTNSPVKLNMANVVASSNYLISQLRGWNFISDEDVIDEESVNAANTITELRDGFDIIDAHCSLFNTLKQHFTTPIHIGSTIFSNNGPIVFQVEMYSGSICRKCNSIVYDEEIMSNWGPEDSNLNTKCVHCKNMFVPSLTINIEDFRLDHLPEVAKKLDPISVPYLSPLVLRKELESILNSEGYASLIRSKFVDDHPIVYWNLLWYFTRLNLPSHISTLALTAQTINRSIQITEKCKFDHRNVSILCLWDNEKLYDNIPLHRRWLQLKANNVASNGDPEIFHQMIDCIRNRDANTPIKYLISERSTGKSKSTVSAGGKRFNSIYRELLFLTLIENIDQINCDIFDRQYCEAFDSLTAKEKESLYLIDSPPSIGAIFCRNLFKKLLLQ